MAQAAYAGLIDVSTDGGATWTPVGGINDANFAPKSDVLDKTAFNSGSSAKQKFLGMDDGQITLAGDYLAADAGQVALRNAKINKTVIRVRIKWDGVAGDYVDTVVPSFNKKGQVMGKVTTDFTCEWTGLPTAF
jgi:hypothetical protein